MPDHMCPDPKSLTGFEIWTHDYLYHRNRNLSSPLAEGKTTVKTYRITITIEDETTNAPAFRWHNQTVITCTTEYTIDKDLVEWVKAEIDKDAVIETDEYGADDYPHNPLNTTCPEAGIKCVCWDIDHPVTKNASDV